MPCTPQSPCPQKLNSLCVTYTGPNIPCAQIYTNDSLDSVIAKLAALSCIDTTTTTSTTSTTTTSTSTIAPSDFTAYWGWVDDLTQIDTPGEIQASVGVGIFTGDITADYTQNSIPKLLYMAEPLNRPIKTKWYGTDLNNGTIGANGDLFASPITIGTYRVYYTNYPTQQTQTPLQFRTT